MPNPPYEQKILELSEKWMKGTITEEEKALLFKWYDQFDDTELTIDPRLKDEMLRTIRREIAPPKALFKKLAVAAAILFLIAGAWYFTSHKSNSPIALEPAPKTTNTPRDTMPGNNKAILTLDNGTTVDLDDAQAGNLTHQGSTQVVKTKDGQLRYVATSTSAPVAYNILTTPRGGQYKLVLQDGTNVWLNAGSSIRYPTAFTGSQRRVEITGEAYLEIAKNPSMPFHVSVKDSQTDIEVLGTSFNVNAYKDEPSTTTTLVEGAIRLTQGRSTVLLHPNEQAYTDASGRFTTNKVTDLGQIIAWKNGAFEFDDAGITSVMRQISRWYDVDVVYEGNIPTDHFTGRFSRNTSLAGVLKILNISGVQLMAENKKIILK